MPQPDTSTFNLFWDYFNTYFPGFLTESSSRIPFKKLKPGRTLDCFCWNQEHRRYEWIRAVLYLSEDEPCSLAIECAISALPRPSSGLDGWAANGSRLCENSKVLADYFDGDTFNIGYLGSLDQTLKVSLSNSSPIIYTAMDNSWDKLIKDNPNIMKCVYALDELRSKYKSILDSPGIVSLEDLEAAFSNQGLPLEEVSKQNIQKFELFKQESLNSRRVYEPGFREEFYDKMRSLGIIKFGFKYFRLCVLEHFEKHDKSIERKNLQEDIARHLSKSGDFNGYEDELTEFSESLAKEEVVEFYILLRDISDRFESEWRGNFVKHFKKFEHDLPPPTS